MKIAIIIPTYNEGREIGRLLEAVLSETVKITKHTFNIIVVDGISTDDTRDIVKQKMAGNNNIFLLIESKRSGLGNAYLTGINYAIETLDVDAFMEFDGDFQHNPKDIVKLIEKFDEGYDYIIGSRYIYGGIIPKEWSWYRKALSSLGNIIIRNGLNINIKDSTSGFKLSRIDGFKDILPIKQGELISLRHAYKIHFLYNMIKAGAKTIEVPINFLNRNKGVSKSTYEDIIESLKVVIILRYRSIKNRLTNKMKLR